MKPVCLPATIIRQKINLWQLIIQIAILTNEHTHSSKQINNLSGTEQRHNIINS